MASSIPVFKVASDAELTRLVESVRDSYASAARSHSETGADPDEAGSPTVPDSEIELAAFPELIGIDPAVYRQIEAALRSGKRHLMFYGPPGTGKTEIARALAGMLHDSWLLITGSADWTSQDVIGGYQPIGGGEIAFVPGVLLKDFDRPLIIDELNRCDIDKVIGPLFTVLSGQATSLPYRTDVTDKDSAQYVILPQPKPGREPHEFAPTAAWRILATINSIDKASLYQMSYALTRRFAWIYVDAPYDLAGFLTEYISRKGLLKGDLPPGSEPPIVGIWRGINAVRPIGAAPVIDMIKVAATVDPTIDFLAPATDAWALAYIDGLYMFLLPMIDGILRHEAEQISGSILAALSLSPEMPVGKSLSQRILGMAIG